MTDPTLRPVDDAPGLVDLTHLIDVRVDVTVELGRTRMTLGEALQIGPGAIVTLERAAGAPLALKVNGKLVARGEVLVVDDVYALRITEAIREEPSALAVELGVAVQAAPRSTLSAGG